MPNNDIHIESDITNFASRDNTPVDLIVIHSTRGKGASDGLELQGTVNWFKNPAAQVSAHMVIATDGDRYFLVPWQFSAWHAGSGNLHSIGIELVQRDIDTPYAGIQLERCAEAVAWLCLKFNIQPVHTASPANHEIGIMGHEEIQQG